MQVLLTIAPLDQSRQLYDRFGDEELVRPDLQIAETRAREAARRIGRMPTQPTNCGRSESLCGPSGWADADLPRLLALVFTR